MYPNAGNYWTEEEERNLRERRSYGTSLRDLSDLHGRTSLAIEWRLAKFAAQELIDDNHQIISPDDITIMAVEHGVPESFIIRWLDTMNPQAYRDDLRAQISTIKRGIKRLREEIVELSNKLSELKDFC